MGPSIHLSTPMNTLTHKTVAGSSLFHTDMEFISTSPYFRQSLSLITLLSGKSEHTHTPTHKKMHKLLFSVGLYPGTDCITDRYVLNVLVACLLSAH